MSEKVSARYEQGLAAYQSGQSVMHLLDVAAEIDKEHREKDADHTVIERSSKAFVAGFADGLINDIRRIVTSPSLTRRGQTA